MALELSYILGTSPETATVILSSFIQQNILFDALIQQKNLDGNSYLSFLSEVTTLFSMIGLLVLLFSPSLWKPKYLISWIFLFLAVTLGGSLGAEFSYNLGKYNDYSILNRPLSADSTSCPDDDGMKDGVCTKLNKSDAIIGALNDVGTPGQKAYEMADDKGKYVVIENGTTKALNINAFAPQVYILYITNRFKESLERALFDLNTSRFNKRLEMLSNMMMAATPSDQLDMWLASFDQLCTNQVDVSTGVMVTKALNGNDAISRLSIMNQQFTVAQLVNTVVQGSIIEKNSNSLGPLIDLGSPHSTQEELENIKSKLLEYYSNNDKTGTSIENVSHDDALRQYTINYPTVPVNKTGTEPKSGFFDNIIVYLGLTNSKNKVDGSQVEAKDSRMGKGIELYTNQMNLNSNDINKHKTIDDPTLKQMIQDKFNLSIYSKGDSSLVYTENGMLLKNGALSQEKANLVLPRHYITKSDVSKMYTDGSNSKSACVNSDMNSAKCKLSFLSKLESDFVQVSNCSEFLDKLVSYYSESQTLDNADFQQEAVAKIVNQGAGSYYAGSYGLQVGGNPNNIGWGGGVAPTRPTKEMIAQASFIRELNNDIKVCEQKTNQKYPKGSLSNYPDMREKLSNELKACSDVYASRTINTYKVNAIRNSINKTKESISQFYSNQFNSMLSGATGVTNFVGGKTAEYMTGVVSGIASLGVGFLAGAYSHILPIIKNILVAFILICTPILFLLGLLVPSWAPGVIITSLITVLYLQMTDIVMVLVQSILVAVDQPIRALIPVSTDEKTYQAFMEVIWGLAYLSTFTLTGFFMFAAGDSKMVMGKIAGMDGQIKSIVDQTNSGAKKAVGLLAPGMGNTLISDNSLFNSATGAAAGTANFLAGKSAGTTTEWSHAIQSKRIAGMKENKKIKDDLSKRADQSNNGKMTSDMMASYNEELDLKSIKGDSKSSLSEDDKKNAYKKTLGAEIEELGKSSAKALNVGGRSHSPGKYVDKFGATIQEDFAGSLYMGEIMKNSDVTSPSSANKAALLTFQNTIAAQDKNGESYSKLSTLKSGETFTVTDKNGNATGKTYSEGSRLFKIPKEIADNNSKLTEKQAKTLGLSKKELASVNSSFARSLDDKDSNIIRGKDHKGKKFYAIETRDADNMQKTKGKGPGKSRAASQRLKEMKKKKLLNK